MHYVVTINFIDNSKINLLHQSFRSCNFL